MAMDLHVNSIWPEGMAEIEEQICSIIFKHSKKAKPGEPVHYKILQAELQNYFKQDYNQKLDFSQYDCKNLSSFLSRLPSIEMVKDDSVGADTSKAPTWLKLVDQRRIESLKLQEQQERYNQRNPELQEFEKNLRELLTTIPEGVLISDLKMKFKDCLDYAFDESKFGFKKTRHLLENMFSDVVELRSEKQNYRILLKGQSPSERFGFRTKSHPTDNQSVADVRNLVKTLKTKNQQEYKQRIKSDNLSQFTEVPIRTAPLGKSHNSLPHNFAPFKAYDGMGNGTTGNPGGDPNFSAGSYSADANGNDMGMNHTHHGHSNLCNTMNSQRLIPPGFDENRHGCQTCRVLGSEVDNLKNENRRRELEINQLISAVSVKDQKIRELTEQLREVENDKEDILTSLADVICQVNESKQHANPRYGADFSFLGAGAANGFEGQNHHDQHLAGQKSTIIDSNDPMFHSGGSDSRVKPIASEKHRGSRSSMNGLPEGTSYADLLKLGNMSLSDYGDSNGHQEGNPQGSSADGSRFFAWLGEGQRMQNPVEKSGF
eukprot:CAMPEP_0114990950 /NCGR_PEP_ID=MMETSP0216-20121206/11089_1 /TAXON_ID=223996 /ORGANISM="Protocruzia adherens, Strain Boccale" /LENGTH=544 /DNA_ID=CAMNT_0002354199 /DNA_START=42 /DNA_END=1676 /DNA_ORIENTATION=+